APLGDAGDGDFAAADLERHAGGFRDEVGGHHGAADVADSAVMEFDLGDARAYLRNVGQDADDAGGSDEDLAGRGADVVGDGFAAGQGDLRPGGAGARVGLARMDEQRA